MASGDRAEAVKVVAEGVAKRLGYSGLKSLQEEVVVSFVTGHDVFAILPTGYGKSLCYFCLPEVFDLLDSPPLPSIIIVVSPLTAIIEDQVNIVLVLLEVC